MQDLSYEKKILGITKDNVNELIPLVTMVLPLFEEKSFTQWYSFLLGQSGPDRIVTNKEVKTRRIIVRRLFRTVKTSTQLKHMLDFMMERVKK